MTLGMLSSFYSSSDTTLSIVSTVALPLPHPTVGIPAHNITHSFPRPKINEYIYSPAAVGALNIKYLFIIIYYIIYYIFIYYYILNATPKGLERSRIAYPPEPVPPEPAPPFAPTPVPPAPPELSPAPPSTPYFYHSSLIPSSLWLLASICKSLLCKTLLMNLLIDFTELCVHRSTISSGV